MVSTGSNIEIGTTISTLNDLATNAVITDQLMILDESASENKRIKLGDLMQSLSFVTGTGVATRVAFWSDTDELSSDANLFWHQTEDCLAIGAAAGTPTGVRTTGDVVVDNASVVGESKVGVLVLRAGLLLQEGGRFPQQVLLQLVFKGLVSCFWEHCLLFKDGHQTHGFLHTVDGRLEIHPEVDHLPLDALPHILLLLKHEPV